MENENQKEVDALCPECGHAFKHYVDRLLQDEPKTSKKDHIDCPVCGCGECTIKS